MHQHCPRDRDIHPHGHSPSPPLRHVIWDKTFCNAVMVKSSKTQEGQEHPPWPAPCSLATTSKNSSAITENKSFWKGFLTSRFMHWLNKDMCVQLVAGRENPHPSTRYSNLGPSLSKLLTNKYFGNQRNRLTFPALAGRSCQINSISNWL